MAPNQQSNSRQPFFSWPRSHASIMPETATIAPATNRAGAAMPFTGGGLPRIPAYLEKNYWWAYLRPASVAVFDHTPVVSAILWGQYARLKRAALAEIHPGQRVLQAACVYGDLSSDLAEKIGRNGRLEVIDITPLQVMNCRRKLAEFPNAEVRVADAAAPGGGLYDAVCCFFLLHELPDRHKRAVVDGLLRSVAPGGNAVFVDYHKPHPLHPLGPITSLVFWLLEPFAKRLWQRGIADFATDGRAFAWRKRTLFGGLFQVVVAERVVDEKPAQTAEQSPDAPRRRETMKRS